MSCFDLLLLPLPSLPPSSSPRFCRPKFTVIVVKKRISTRLFAARGRDLSNPPPGTVVDTKVTKPEW